MGDCGAVEDAVEVLEAARELYTVAQVDAAIDRMATEITGVVQQENPVILAVMRGGAFTATELCRRLRFPYEFEFVHGTRYGDGLDGRRAELACAAFSRPGRSYGCGRGRYSRSRSYDRRAA